MKYTSFDRTVTEFNGKYPSRPRDIWAAKERARQQFGGGRLDIARWDRGKRRKPKPTFVIERDTPRGR